MSNEMTESGAKAAGLNWATVALCILVAALAAVFFWPRAEPSDVLTIREIRMTSPDGQRTLRITCENSGAGVYISSLDGARVAHIHSGDLGDQLTLGARSPQSSLIRLTTLEDTQYGAIPRASIKVYDHEGNTSRVPFEVEPAAR